jgi:hypothetical protein
VVGGRLGAAGRIGWGSPVAVAEDLSVRGRVLDGRLLRRSGLTCLGLAHAGGEEPSGWRLVCNALQGKTLRVVGLVFPKPADPPAA